MLTYDLTETSLPLYDALYSAVKADILSGRLAPGEKLPSKRALAQHLRLSVATVQNAYAQLLAEGYLYSEEKRGYFVSTIGESLPVPPQKTQRKGSADLEPAPRPVWFADLVSNSISAEDFPFTVWSRTMRRVILEKEKQLLLPLEFNGHARASPRDCRSLGTFSRSFGRSGPDYCGRGHGISVHAGDSAFGA